MHHPTAEALTWEDLDTALAAQAGDTMPAWLTGLRAGAPMPNLDDDDLCDLAAETDPRGTASTVAGVLQALRVLHASDRVTLALLAALEGSHLPALRDEWRGA